MPSITTNHPGDTCSSVQITTLRALLCNKHMQKAYVFFSSSVDSAPFLCFLNFTNPSTIPTTRTTQTPPATSPPKKVPTATTLLPSIVRITLDCSSAMCVAYNTWLCIHRTGVTLMLYKSTHCTVPMPSLTHTRGHVGKVTNRSRHFNGVGSTLQEHFSHLQNCFVLI